MRNLFCFSTCADVLTLWMFIPVCHSCSFPQTTLSLSCFSLRFAVRRSHRLSAFAYITSFPCGFHLYFTFSPLPFCWVACHLRLLVVSCAALLLLSFPLQLCLLPELRSVDHFRTRSGRLIISLYNSLCPFDRFKQYLFFHYFHCWSNPLSWNLQKTHTKFISTCTFFPNQTLFEWNSYGFSHTHFCSIFVHSVNYTAFPTVAYTQNSIHCQCLSTSPDHGMELFYSKKITLMPSARDYERSAFENITSTDLE